MKILIVAVVVILSSISGQTFAGDDKKASSISMGNDLAFNRKKGNCLACHQIKGGSLPGNSGPPLILMKTRFPDRAVLRDQIADASKKNPQSVMPPFGRHGILSDKEIDHIVDFIYSL